MDHHTHGIIPKKLSLFTILPKKTSNKFSKKHSSSCFVGPHHFAALFLMLIQFLALLHLPFQYSKHSNFIAVALIQILLKLVTTVKLRTKKHKLFKTITNGEISSNILLCYVLNAQIMSSPN